MDMLEFIKKRKTTYEFTDKKLQKGDIENILEAARWAPSSHNSQPWEFVVVTDRTKITKLIGECYYGAFHTTPPMLIVVVAESKKASGKGLGKLESELLYTNIAMPAINMCFEAQSLGIGSCILTPIGTSVGGMLGLPGTKKVHILVGLGYEKPGAVQKKRTRKELSALVRYETYS